MQPNINRALILAVVGSCVVCASNSPIEATSAPATLAIVYHQASPPPPEARGTGCTHHFAPIDLQVNTDWGATAKLQRVQEGVFQGTFSSPPAGDHWITVVDVTLCRSQHSASRGHKSFDPYAIAGVSVNNVELRRAFQLFEPPRHGLAFTVTSAGTIEP